MNNTGWALLACFFAACIPLPLWYVHVERLQVKSAERLVHHINKQIKAEMELAHCRQELMRAERGGAMLLKQRDDLLAAVEKRIRMTGDRRGFYGLGDH
jgi:hypothetical protein